MKQVSFKVYRASHPTAGSYVGLTVRTMGFRKGVHHETARKGKMSPFCVALRGTGFKGWTWETLSSHTNREDGGVAEIAAIQTLAPSLNVRSGGAKGGGGKWPSWFAHGGWKNRGRKHSPETIARRVESIRKMRLECPRTRKADRNQIFALHREGLKQGEIARRLSCSQALVSNVIRGVYKL